MQAVNNRGDTVVFELEDSLQLPVRRVELPSHAQADEVGLARVTQIRNAGLSQVTIKVNTTENLVTLPVGEALPVEPDLMDLIAMVPLAWRRESCAGF